MTKQFTLDEINALIAEERAKPIHKPFQLIDPNSRLAKLYRMQGEVMKRQREEWQDKHLADKIDCPFEDHSGHQATIFKAGHRFEGIVECDKTGESDSCQHEETHVESLEVDTMRNGEHDTYEVPAYVCDACECVTDEDVTDDREDMAYDEWRDNQLEGAVA